MTLKSKALNSSHKFIIALDGPAASGKGTIGQMLAQKFNLVYFQSSIVYRGLALSCVLKKIDLNNIAEIISLSESIEYIKSPELDDEYIGNIASRIAVIPEVRTNLSKYLIKLIKTTNRIIMEGKDIGTVIAPQADLKIFIKADINVRAKRRYNQLREKGKDCILSEIFDQLQARDKMDQERSFAPLLPASDALVIDTSDLTPSSVIEKIVEYISSR